MKMGDKEVKQAVDQLLTEALPSRVGQKINWLAEEIDS